MIKSYRLLIIIMVCASFCACSSTNSNFSPKAQTDVSNVDVVGLIKGEKKPPPPEVVKAQLQEQGRNWLYGYGFGKTMLNVGTVIVFPPYGLFLLGNAGLQIAGYEPIDVTEALPKKASKPINILYNGVTSVPGRIAAGIAQEPFRDKLYYDALALPSEHELSITEEELDF